jgi:hypothetical protein
VVAPVIEEVGIVIDLDNWHDLPPQPVPEGFTQGWIVKMERRPFKTVNILICDFWFGNTLSGQALQVARAIAIFFQIGILALDERVRRNLRLNTQNS